MIKKKLIAWLTFLWFLPATVLAQHQGNPSAIIPNSSVFGNILPGDSNDTAGWWIGVIIRMVLSIAGLVAVALIIWGGFRYITARGDDKVVGEAKKTITNALIGLVIIILSYVIVTVVTNAAFGNVR